MELIYIKKGCGTVQLDMQPMDAKAEDIFVVPPGSLHALREQPGMSMEYENIIFDVEFLGSAAADICAQEYLIPLSVGQLLAPMRLRLGEKTPSLVGTNVAVSDTADLSIYPEIAACLNTAERLCEIRPRGYELGVKAAVLSLISLLVPMCPDTPREESPYTERLKTVLSRVEQDYTKPLSIQDMADSCGCSSSHFMRWFRQMTGSSFTAYVNERRLAYAAEQLRQSNDKIILIAENAGFENLSNFNRQFKTRYGVTPSGYRRRI
ncbi:MAG: AraC family transcriptional regulator [Lachnospiraceae bacterium]|nr:AraC family transcriptional regulator [Lachnospiraceae bacterium]